MLIMVMMVMAKTCILEQPLVFEVEVEGKGEVAFAQGGLDTLLDHLQLGLQVGGQVWAQVVEGGPVPFASLAGAGEVEKPWEPVLPFLFADLTEVHTVNVTCLKIDKILLTYKSLT